MTNQSRAALGRFQRIYRRYGLVHAAAAGLGRKSQTFWALAGPIVTHGYARRYIEKTRPRYLNLGAGSHIIEGMLNVDISPRADTYVDLTSPIPFEDDTFEFIYSEEVIEHFDRETSQQVLREAFRILAPGGLARFTTPRLEYFVSRFHDEDPTGADINEIFYCHSHRYIYSVRSLSAAMMAAGFVDIRFTNYRDPTSVLGRFDTHADRYGHPAEMSLYVEGRKA